MTLSVYVRYEEYNKLRQNEENFLRLLGELRENFVAVSPLIIDSLYLPPPLTLEEAPLHIAPVFKRHHLIYKGRPLPDYDKDAEKLNKIEKYCREHTRKYYNPAISDVLDILNGENKESEK